MLVLQLMLLTLSIICLMESHAEVSSSTTGMRERSTPVSANRSNVQTLDRKKKKKSKKSKKPKKPKKPKEPKPGSSDTCYDARDKGTSSYRGTQSTTKSGRTCQKWTEQNPHSHDKTPENFPDGGLGDHNYCRRPLATGIASSPWCYTIDKNKRWEHCGIPFCQTCIANKKPCLFPFKDDEKKEHNECADQGGKFFWCATNIDSTGKYTSWERCPKDGSCPLPPKTTMPVMTPTVTAATTLLTTETLSAESTITNVEDKLKEIGNILHNLEPASFTNDEMDILETMTNLEKYFNTTSLTRNVNDPVKINSYYEKLTYGIQKVKSTKTITPGFYDSYKKREAACSQSVDNAKLSQVNVGPGRRFIPYTVTKTETISDISTSSLCCSKCKILAVDSQLFEYSIFMNKCDCYKVKPGYVPETMFSSAMDSGVCQPTGFEWVSESKGHLPHPEESRMFGACKSETYNRRWPWLVSISNDKGTVNGIPNGVSCTGTLITCKHVLTALHCLLDDTKTQANAPANIKVFVGSYKLFGSNDPKDVQQIFHDKFPFIEYRDRNSVPRHDIAVMKLTQDVCIRGTVYYVNVPSFQLEDVYKKSDFWVVAFGANGFHPKEDPFETNNYMSLSPIQSDDLRESNEFELVVDQGEIDKIVKSFEDSTHPMLDAYFKQSKSPSLCGGDSGAPGIQEVNGITYVFTIHTFTMGKCSIDENIIAVNKKVFSYYQDIRTWMIQ